MHLKAILLSTVMCFIVACASNNRSQTQFASNFIHRQKVTNTTKQSYPPKNPQNVAIYSKEKPYSPYRVIGVATVSKHNLLGHKRKPELVEAMMKKLAASIGGDALINVSDNKDQIEAHVIQFQRLLL